MIWHHKQGHVAIEEREECKEGGGREAEYYASGFADRD